MGVCLDAEPRGATKKRLFLAVKQGRGRERLKGQQALARAIVFPRPGGHLLTEQPTDLTGQFGGPGVVGGMDKEVEILPLCQPLFPMGQPGGQKGVIVLGMRKADEAHHRAVGRGEQVHRQARLLALGIDEVYYTIKVIIW